MQDPVVWKVKEFKERVAAISGIEVAESLSEVCTSADWKIAIANYHIAEARSRFSDFFDGTGNKMVQVFKYISGTDDRAQQFNVARVEHEAHLIAAAQAVHSIADIIAQVIDVLGFFSPFGREKVSFWRVLERLPETELKVAMTEVSRCKEFEYLNAFVNVTKHRSIVFSRYVADLSEPSAFKHGVKYKSFSYGGREFDAKWSEDFVGEMQEVVRRLILIGIQADAAYSRNSI